MSCSLDDLELISVATDYNDAVKRFVQSCEKYDFSPTILGLEDKWNGGIMIKGKGGGQKVNLLRNYLKKLNKNKLIIFTDSYDVIANNNLEHFYNNYNLYYVNKIVFGSETSCWPNKNLASEYPSFNNNKNIYLNSGNFVGYKDDLLKIMEKEIQDDDDDQEYFTHYFLESIKNSHNNIALDYDYYLFVCLNDCDNYKLDNYKSCLLMENQNRPTFIHGNGPLNIKRKLNQISNVCLREFNQIEQQIIDNYIDKSEWCIDLPVIKVIFDTNSDDKDFLNTFKNIFYPKEKLDIEKISLPNLLDKIDNISSYIFDYVLYINSDVIIKNKYFLLDLVLENKSVVAPLFRSEDSIKSNFWGDLDKNNFYKRSTDYIDIVDRNIRGSFNVPYISSCFLIRKNLFNKELFINNFEKGEGMDMSMCYNLRKKNIFLWILNKDFYGYYIN